MITTEYQLTADEYAEAQAGGFRAMMGRKMWFLYLLMAMLPLGIAMSLVGGPDVFQQFKPAMILGALVTAFLVLNQTGVLHRWQFSKNQGLQETTNLQADDLGLSLASSRGSSTINWASFRNWKEIKSSFVLFPQSRIMFVVPKRAFDAESLNGFRRMLQEKIPG